MGLLKHYSKQTNQVIVNFKTFQFLLVIQYTFKYIVNLKVFALNSYLVLSYSKESSRVKIKNLKN